MDRRSNVVSSTSHSSPARPERPAEPVVRVRGTSRYWSAPSKNRHTSARETLSFLFRPFGERCAPLTCGDAYPPPPAGILGFAARRPRHRYGREKKKKKKAGCPITPSATSDDIFVLAIRDARAVADIPDPRSRVSNCIFIGPADPSPPICHRANPARGSKRRSWNPEAHA